MLSTMKYDKNDQEQILDPVSVDIMSKGYSVVSGAVDSCLIDDLVLEMKDAVKNRNRSDVLYQQHGSGKTYPITEMIGEPKGVRLVDLMMSMQSAQKVLLSEKIVGVLSMIFDKPPVLFQSLSFEYGSQQALHQDTAYVVTNPPMNLVGVWIALEDIQPGSGELQYVPGSHLFPYFFQQETNKFHWNRDIDGDDLHAEYLDFLLNETMKRECSVESFLPKKGDALIWHSQLAHGGSRIHNENFTRRSIVGHFYPLGTLPNWANEHRTPKLSEVNPSAFVMTQY